MKFILNRNAKHLRAEGIDESFREKIGRVAGNVMRTFMTAAGPIFLVSAIAAGMPTAAYAAESGSTDTTNQTTQEQTVDVNDFVAPVEETTPVVETAPVEATAPVVETTPVEVTTPAVETTPVEVTAPVEETTPGINEEINQRIPEIESEEQNTQETTQVEETTPGINEEINQRVPEIESEEQNTQETTPVEETTPGINEEINQRVPEIESEEQNTQETTQVEETAPGINEEINQRVPEIETEEQNTQETTQVEETAPIEEDNQENINSNYQVIEQDGKFIIIGDIPEENIPQITEELTLKYGESIKDAILYNINSLEVGETVNLGGTNYQVTKNEDGTFTIEMLEDKEKEETNENNEISQEENVETTEQAPIISVVDKVPDEIKDQNITVENIKDNEYIITNDGEGKYYIGLGGIGLDNEKFQDLLSRLQKEGIIPAHFDYTAFILPDAPTAESGMTETIIQITDDLFVSTQDGVNFKFYSQNDNLLNNIQEYSDEHLVEKDELGNKADEDIPTETPTEKPDNPEPDNPEPDNPEPNNPEPSNPAPTPEPDMPKTGDPTSLTGTLVSGVAGVGALGAGMLLGKKKKKENDLEKLDDDNSLKKATTYEELEQLAQTQIIDPHDYDDDLEMFAKAYILSKEQEKKQNAEIKKNKIR